MLENMSQHEYVEENYQKVDELISMVEKLVTDNADKLTVRSAFKELKSFVRIEYEKIHKKKYFGSYIFDWYHPVIEKIHLTALGETRVNASVECIDNAVKHARLFYKEWYEKLESLKNNNE
ncbi:MAG: hypothetical protein RR310_01545 [Eubacterium sp.]